MNPPRRRQHPRAGRHRVPEVLEQLEAPPVLEPPRRRRTDTEPHPLATLEESPPPLRAEQIARLEALTQSWMLQARLVGAGEDATMFYKAPPPPPPARVLEQEHVSEEEHPMPVESDPVPAVPSQPPAAPAGPPVLVRDWSSRHDPRSLNYSVRARLRAAVPIQTYVRGGAPVLDQGTTPPLSLHDASGCVGFGVVTAANVIGGQSRVLGRDDALHLYDRAQHLDSISGEAYAGTSVLAGMLAGREAGLWDEFLWAFGTKDVAQAVLQVGPVVVGIPWGPSLDKVDRDGIITPGADLNAGHCLAVVGIVKDRGGRPGPFFVLQQSRGPNYGDRGLVYLHHKHLAGLLAGVGEAAIPVPPGATM